jgi:hypothetical protein
MPSRTSRRTAITRAALERASRSAALGVRFRFGKPGSRLRAYVDANYHALALRSLLDSKNDGDTIVNVGTTDVFHGPVAALGVSF